ncbi:MAG: hypothetical protein ABEH40_00900 [Haloferacaceae archaeon]
MRRTTLVGVVLAALVLVAGTAAAAPGSTAADSDRAAAGPPSDLPGPVPDFVTEILDVIGSFLSGDRGEAPGPAVSDAAGSGG